MEPISLNQGRLRRPILRLQNDERLARLAAAGDDAAFEALVRRHGPTLRRACGRVLAGPQAEDAAQQALLNAHRALRRNGPPDLFEPWLYRIAFNAALKELEAAPDALPLDEEGLVGSEQPDERAEGRERLRATLGAIGALPESQRRALVLREMEGRSHDEIARDLGLSRGAVRQLIHRARNSVRTAATALTPYGLLLRAASDSDGSTRIAELVAGGGAGAYAAKTLVAAVVAGGIAGGVALVPQDGTPAGASGQRSGDSGGGGPAPSTLAVAAGTANEGRGHREEDRREDGKDEREHDGEGKDDNSGPGGAHDGSGGDGPRPGSDNSGPGSGSSGGGGHGGSGSSGGGSGTSGGGSGTSGGGSGSSGGGSGTSGGPDGGGTNDGSGSGSSGSSGSGSGSGEGEARRQD